jgi:hypothetical protein
MKRIDSLVRMAFTLTAVAALASGAQCSFWGIQATTGFRFGGLRLR